jgi:hypothetical protein
MFPASILIIVDTIVIDSPSLAVNCVSHQIRVPDISIWHTAGWNSVVKAVSLARLEVDA